MRSYWDFFLIVSFLLIQRVAWAQSSYFLVVKSDLSNVEQISEDKRDSTAIKKIVSEQVSRLQNDHYLLASLDSLLFLTDTAYAKIYAGPQIKSIQISNADKLPREFSIKRLSGIQELNALRRRYVSVKGSQGYPFSRIWLDSIRTVNGQVHGKLAFDQGPYIAFDSLNLVNKAVVNQKFLAQWLEITYDDPFSQKTVDRIQIKVRSLDFLRLKTPPSTSFQLSRALITVDVEERKVNQFDGILGVVPASNSGESRITGELNLVLKNLFRRGRGLTFNWIKLRERSQQLKASYRHPLIFGSPLILEVGYDQLKEDTLFSNRNIQLDLAFPITPDLTLSFNYNNTNGNNLRSIATENGDFDIDYYGLGLQWKTLDDPVFPTKGNDLRFNARVGAKKATSILGERRSSSQYLFKGYLNQYFDLGKQKVLFGGVEMGWIQNSQPLFLNDLFRIGGLRSIRGFNENFFFASKYLLTNLELRFQFERQSYFFLFADQAFLEYQISAGELTDNPSGIGAGFQLKMNGGVFNIVYGLGRTSQEGFSFDTSKIHFGYTGNF